MDSRELSVEKVSQNDTRLFVRLTRITDTDEGLQQSRIHINVYDNEEIAWSYYQNEVSFAKWEEAIREGETFFSKRMEGFTNLFFLEIRRVLL